LLIFQGVKQVLTINKLTAGFSKDGDKGSDDDDAANKPEEKSVAMSLKSVSKTIFFFMKGPSCFTA